MSYTNPPTDDEIEISIFGQGYGECVLIHLFQNNWIIIDSCINPSTRKPAALEYLESIGVDTNSAVKAIIATHWHDDHIRGIGKTFASCSSADFFCSDALNYKEFITLVETYENNIMAKDTGIDEFKQIVKIMIERETIPHFASANQLIWKKEMIGSKGEKHNCLIHSLSPSSRSKLAAMVDIQRNQQREKSPKKRVIASSPNHAAIALWVSIGDYNILLGSDLEETGHPLEGWTAILNSQLRPEGVASCFKVPHHGSANAHHDDIWNKMIDLNHISILTPFVKGNKTLPSKEDVQRICGRSSNSFSSSSLIVKRRVKRGQLIEKMIKDTVKSIRLTNPSFGQVRIRIPNDRKSLIELFLSAVPLNKLYN